MNSEKMEISRRVFSVLPLCARKRGSRLPAAHTHTLPSCARQSVPKEPLYLVDALAMSGEKHLYAIHCLDDQSCGRAEGEPRGGSVKRMSNYPVHKEYQMKTANPEDPLFIDKVAAGPMVEEDDKYMVGSFFLVSATREEAQKFVDNDPFKKEGVWETIKVERYVSVVGVKPHSGNL